ncbi:homogentisate 1,2-dioxygenase [Sphingopyxis sp. DBS4]|uniref:homogentisate 1,2-dioxygenase n=1 Tax=Sphingopyxis sp. DBS4 TaxID=2968500 RepID=UPI00214C7589|nr:homogentisate 1,2-dioxygenase [Sphingopyxis sp. DBS4]
MKLGIFLAAGLFALEANAGAAAAPAKPVQACPANPVLPPELSDWSRAAASKTIYAYGEPREASWPSLGAARTRLELHRFESLRYASPPERKPDPFKYGGMVPIEIKTPGRLVVALGAGAWIDLVRDGAFVKSVAHGHGPDCSGIRKMVEFDVEPGRYLLQISSAPAASIDAMAILRD